MTTQIGERLIYKGKNLSILDRYSPTIPKHPRITEIPEELNKISYTSCWRKYIGTWEIKDGRFYLKELIGRFTLGGDEPLFADWFTGELRVPIGEMLEFIDYDDAIYKKELFIKIKEGMVKKTKTVRNYNRFIGRLRRAIRSVIKDLL